jgi:hypothetical protein
MAHYAFLDENNVVVDIIVGKDENELDNNGNPINWEKHYEEFSGFKCKRTSYNTIEGTHLAGKEPFRKNYAIIGGTYDEQKDAFIAKKLFESWTLDEETCTWKPPVPRPLDDKHYVWNEEEQKWDEVPFNLE